MTKLAIFPRGVRSIFRKRKVAPKTNDDDVIKLVKAEEEDTVKLEETESDDTLNDSCSFDCVPPKEAVALAEPIKPKKSVSFSAVTVRQYDLVLGDNPSCRFPLSLGWNHNQEETVNVDSFEEQRGEREAQASNNRIQPRLYAPHAGADHYLCDVHTEQDYDDKDSKLIAELSLYERRARLRSFGYTEADLRLAERHRIISLALEWKDGGTPLFLFSNEFIMRYTR